MNRDLGLLALRLGSGAMMIYGHGWGKVLRILDGKFSFADPIGLGPALSLILAAFAEAICSLLVILGVSTRWAAVPPLLTMLVAGLIHHADDPFGRKELALLYAVAFLTLALTGAGKYALDSVLRKRRRS